MIINALKRYYEILAEDEESDVPLYGYCKAKVGFALNISELGELLDVIPLKVEVQAGNKKILTTRTLIVPEQHKRSGTNAPANFLCDNSKYVLGISQKSDKKVISNKEFNKFRELHRYILKEATGKAAKAVLAFLDNWDVNNSISHPVLSEYVEEILEGSNLVFRLDGREGYIHDDLEIKSLWENYHSQNEQAIVGQCSVTGEYTPIAKLHPNIKNVKNAQSSGASLVSFNENAYESYGKTRGYIAPIGQNTAFAYTTVLNHMLASQKQKIQVGDSTTVFWAESPDDIYVDLAYELFNPTNSKSNSSDGGGYDRKQIEALVRDVLDRSKSGMKVSDQVYEKVDEDTTFHILGLSPNASRLSVRFFHSDSFGGFMEKTAQHYQDIEIIKDFADKPTNIPIWMMLRETISPKGSSKEATPLLAGAIMRAIITGSLYPEALFNSIMMRVRTDTDDKERNIQKVNYVRAAIIKGYLLRKARLRKNNKLKEVMTVGLNEESINTEYLLGRLFAVLEKSQQDVSSDLNTTIKDRYFASACATPAAVFPILLKLTQHHISKSDYGVAIEKRIAPIMNKISEFPSHLTLEQQGTFILGYYHQRVALFQKKEKRNESHDLGGQTNE